MISDINTKITAQSECHIAHHCVEHKMSVSSQKCKKTKNKQKKNCLVHRFRADRKPFPLCSPSPH